MRRDYVHYYSSRKNPHHGDAILQGFNARKVPVEMERLEKGVHIVGGLQFGSLSLMRQLRKNNEPFVFVDRAYFNGGPGSNRLRIVNNAYQHNWMQAGLPRLDKSVQVKPWRKSGNCIMVVPPSQAIASLFELGDWERKTLEKLDEVTQRPVFVSYKGDRLPLEERLKKCHAVVTYSSNVAVEATCFGVPSFVGPNSAALPVSGGSLENIDHPNYADDDKRNEWVNFLQWGQFSIDQIQSGYARKITERMSVQKAA